MEANTILLLLVASMALLVSSSSSSPTSPFPPPPRYLRSQELIGATQEMQRANYFTFVTLINMSPQLIQSNITFLMPNDRLLAGVSDLSPDSVSDFLLRHSIPSPLLFESLTLIPSGSILPSSKSGYFLSISNGGRKSYVINNVKVISPNICSSSASTVRCHGINGVLSETSNYTAPANASVAPLCPSNSAPSPSPSPSPSYEHVAAAPASQLAPVLPPPATEASSGNNNTFAVAPAPAASSACGRLVLRLFVSSFVVLASMLFV